METCGVSPEGTGELKHQNKGIRNLSQTLVSEGVEICNIVNVVSFCHRVDPNAVVEYLNGERGNQSGKGEVSPDEVRMRASCILLILKNSGYRDDSYERVMDYVVSRPCILEFLLRRKATYAMNIVGYIDSGLTGLLLSGSITEDVRDSAYFPDHTLEGDLVWFMDYEPLTIKKVVNRCGFLMANALTSWNTYLKDLYAAYFRIIYLSVKHSRMQMDLLRECLEIFPQEEILGAINSSERSSGSMNPPREGLFRPLTLPTPLMAYIFGVDISTIDVADGPMLEGITRIISRLFNQSEIDQRMSRMNRRSLNLYLDNLREINPEKDFVVMNRENTDYERIDRYSPFDVARYCDSSGKIFQFTRNEFHLLINNSENFMTRSPVPDAFLETLRSKIVIADRFNLPNSIPASERYKRMVDPEMSLSEYVKQTFALPVNDIKEYHDIVSRITDDPLNDFTPSGDLIKNHFLFERHPGNRPA